MKVKVREDLAEGFTGFFGYDRRRPGDVFTIDDEPRRDLFPGEKKLVEGNAQMKAVYDRVKDKDGKVPSQFSFRWMTPVAEATPERVSTAQQAVTARNETIKAERAAAKAASEPGKGDVI